MVPSEFPLPSKHQLKESDDVKELAEGRLPADASKTRKNTVTSFFILTLASSPPLFGSSEPNPFCTFRRVSFRKSTHRISAQHSHLLSTYPPLQHCSSHLLLRPGVVACLACLCIMGLVLIFSYRVIPVLGYSCCCGVHSGTHSHVTTCNEWTWS